VNDKNGLIFAHELDGSGGGTSINWDGVKKWRPESGTLWLHLDYSGRDAQKWLVSETGRANEQDHFRNEMCTSSMNNRKKNKSGEFEMVKAKLIAALILVAVVIVVVLQNTQPVETKFLFMTMIMPRAALLGITLLIGIASGILLALGLSAKHSKKD